MATKKATAGKSAKMSIAESKLPKEKKLTKDKIVTADQMDAEIQKKLFDIPQSINAKKDLNLDSDYQSILDANSQNPPSQDGEKDENVSDG